MTAPDYDAILSGAQLPEDVVPVCTRGDLVGRYNALAQQALAARQQAAADPRMAGSGGRALAKDLDALKAQIEAATVPFRLRALTRQSWHDLVDEHPPRVDEVTGQRIPADSNGINAETFYPALIRSCTVEPQLREDTWENLLDPASGLLTTPQFVKLRTAAWELNRQDQDIPFSLAASLVMRLFDKTSDLPDPSESAASG